MGRLISGGEKASKEHGYQDGETCDKQEDRSVGYRIKYVSGSADASPSQLKRSTTVRFRKEKNKG
jgi:hypothetical protein